MTRKIIQICVAHDYRGRVSELIALCDDGSLWRLPDGIPWQPIADVPQPREADPNFDHRLPVRTQLDESDF